MQLYDSIGLLPLGRIPILFYQRNFIMVGNLSITAHTFPMHMLALLSVDEILLPGYVKWSANFRGTFLFKTYELCFIHVETNALCCIFYYCPAQQRWNSTNIWKSKKLNSRLCGVSSLLLIFHGETQDSASAALSIISRFSSVWLFLVF